MPAIRRSAQAGGRWRLNAKGCCLWLRLIGVASSVVLFAWVSLSPAPSALAVGAITVQSVHLYSGQSCDESGSPTNTFLTTTPFFCAMATFSTWVGFHQVTMQAFTPHGQPYTDWGTGEQTVTWRSRRMPAGGIEAVAYAIAHNQMGQLPGTWALHVSIDHRLWRSIVFYIRRTGTSTAAEIPKPWTDRKTDMQVWIVRITQTTKGDEFLSPKGGHEWIIFRIVIRNLGRRPQSWNGADFNAVDQGGITYDLAFLPSSYPQLGFGDMPGHEQRQGDVGFEVPLSTRTLLLTWTDSANLDPAKELMTVRIR